MYKCKEMSASAYSRVFADSREYKKCYRNIKSPFEFNNIMEMAKYLYKHFYDSINDIIIKGESPSVDRIDTSIGYTKDNIRIISRKENTMMGVEKRKRMVSCKDKNGNTLIFDSTSDCVEHFGYKRNSSSKVKSWVDKNGNYKIPEGFSEFKYLT